LINQKNLKRINDALAVQTNIAAIPEVMSASEFLRDNCVGTTPNQVAGKIATVKIPDSFPEICILLYIVSYRLVPTNDLADDIIASLWSSSLAWGANEQERNKVYVKRAWDSWGTSSGKKQNSLGQTIQFDEEIYANQAADKIMLLNPNGSEAPFEINAASGNVGIPDGYNKARLIVYIEHVKTTSAGVIVPDSQLII
jgi:hypothetical protein